MTLAELAAALPPGEHDLETFALWLAMARECGWSLQPGAWQQIESPMMAASAESHGLPRQWRLDGDTAGAAGLGGLAEFRDRMYCWAI